MSKVTKPLMLDETGKQIAEAIKNFGAPNDAQAKQAIREWLDNHPEATSTVQDGSLTIDKFTEEAKWGILKDFVSPEMYGAVGDGVTDDTEAFKTAVNTGKPIILTRNYYIAPSETMVLKNSLYATGGTLTVESVEYNRELANKNRFCGLYLFSIHSGNISVSGLKIKTECDQLCEMLCRKDNTSRQKYGDISSNICAFYIGPSAQLQLSDSYFDGCGSVISNAGTAILKNVEAINSYVPYGMANNSTAYLYNCSSSLYEKAWSGAEHNFYCWGAENTKLYVDGGTHYFSSLTGKAYTEGEDAEKSKWATNRATTIRTRCSNSELIFKNVRFLHNLEGNDGNSLIETIEAGNGIAKFINCDIEYVNYLCKQVDSNNSFEDVTYPNIDADYLSIEFDRCKITMGGKQRRVAYKINNGFVGNPVKFNQCEIEGYGGVYFAHLVRCICVDCTIKGLHSLPDCDASFHGCKFMDVGVVNFRFFAIDGGGVTPAEYIGNTFIYRYLQPDFTVLTDELTPTFLGNTCIATGALNASMQTRYPNNTYLADYISSTK